MGKADTPPPPDPQAVGAAQTGTNVNTALANMLLNSMNQTTPQGSISYDFGNLPELPAQGPAQPEYIANPNPPLIFDPDQGGYIRDPNSQIRNPDYRSGSVPAGFYRDPSGGYTIVEEGGTRYNIPSISSEITLSPQQQAIKDQTDATQLGLASFANSQVDRLSGIYNQPFSYDGLPAGGDISGVAAQRPTYQNIGWGPQMQTSFDRSPVVEGGHGIPQGGQGLQYGVSGAGGGFQYGVPGAGQGFTYDVPGAGVGVSRGQMLNAGQGIQGSVASGGDRITGIDRGNISDYAGRIEDAGNITRSYNTDFSEDRRRVEEALLARINPDLERDAERERTRLANQGINLGSTAFDRGVDQLGRQANDARFGAVLAGGQEQSRMVGLERDRAMFQNAAQQQQWAQNAEQAYLQNQAAQSELARELALAGFSNDAINSIFAENLARGNFQNTAQGQGFDQRLAASQQNNAGQGQAFSQRFGVAGLSNAATDAAFGQRLSSAQLNNQARNDAFGQRLASAGLNNQAQGQGFDQQIAAQGQGFDQMYQSQVQDYLQNLGAAQFGNEAQQQGYQNRIGAIDYNNQQRANQFGAATDFYNLQNQDRDRGINEATNLRNQPLNEIAALLGGSGVQMPSFLPGYQANIPTVDQAGLMQDQFATLTGNANSQNAARQQQAAAAASAAAMIAAAAISDRRLKADVERVGDYGPVGLYRFRYLWDRSGVRRIGVMAQEVLRHLPEAVLHNGRWLMVDYARIAREWA